VASFGLEFANLSPHIIDAEGVLSCGMQVLLEHRHLMASPHTRSAVTDRNSLAILLASDCLASWLAVCLFRCLSV
jgi:hypothetical protein